MIFEPLPVAGAFLVSLEEISDNRGFFARMFCGNIWKEHGLTPEVSQVNVSLTKNAGTIRGLHFQTSPHEEAKLIRCIHGSIFDVAAHDDCTDKCDSASGRA